MSAKTLTLVLTALLLMSGCGAQSHLTVRGEGISALHTLPVAVKAVKIHSGFCAKIGAAVETRSSTVAVGEGRKGPVSARYVAHSGCIK